MRDKMRNKMRAGVALAVAAALLALGVQAQTTGTAAGTDGGQPQATEFVIRDIRVEGVQRSEPGSVFTNLPFRVGDTFTPDKGSQAIRTLFGAGIYNDVRIGTDGDVVVVTVTERPAVAGIESTGIRAFDKDGLIKTLRDAGLAEGRIFDRSLLERAMQELRKQYQSKGLFGVEVKTTVTPVERNRVQIGINVDEGRSSSIREIRFVGVNAFDEDDLFDEMQLGTPNWLSWYTKRDHYAREKLAADLESIRSFYQNRGYLDFEIESVQVSVSPDKSGVFVTINVTEGPCYKLTDLTVGGDLLGLDDVFQKSLKAVKLGTTYNAEAIENVGKDITSKLTSMGYAFAKVTPAPLTDKEKGEVKIALTVDPGRRTYVRRVNITGNTKTRDDIIRREVRQYEAAWFDSSKVSLSRDRIDRLGYFEEVKIDHTPVEGIRDQVDLDVKVKERPTGSISLGVGYSTSDGIILSAGFSQDNVFGTGNNFSMEFNTSDSERTYAISFTQPYITPTGISRTWDIYDRSVDLDDLDLVDVKYETRGLGLRYGIPVTELDRIYLGGKAEQTIVTLRDDSPDRYRHFVKQFGKDPFSAAATIGWSRDSRDSALVPTRGMYQNAQGEVSVPVLDLYYYKFTYQLQHYLPLTKRFTLATNIELGYGKGYGGKEYPFFKNFYAGGIGSVRGFETSSLGPRDTDGDAMGGDRKINASLELQWGLPGADKSLRLFTFLDAGSVWGYSYDKSGHLEHQGVSLSDLRYSVGFGLSWSSPIGPLKFSMGYPIKKKSGDKTEHFQFQMGTGF